MVALLAVFLMAATACGGGATSTPSRRPAGTTVPAATTAPVATAVSAATSTPAIQTLPAGQQLFIIKGCAACHGHDAEGTRIAPALPGHSGNQVRRQVRAPVGSMPVFPLDKVTNDDLEAIAGFIESLQGGHLHQRPTAVADALAQHHWMALFALEDGSGEEAAHHIDHINQLVSGDHLARMQESLLLIEQGDLHDAAHLIEGMTAGTAAPDVTEPAMHLRLALSSSAVEEPEDAGHHLEHFLSSAQPNSLEAETAAEAIALLEAGELTEAGHTISDLVGEVDEEDHDDEEEEDHENHDTPVTTTPPAAEGDPAAGQAVFLAQGCGACHTVRGVPGAAGAVGPELTQVATNATSRIAGTSAEAYIRQSVEDPSAFLVEGFGPLMPTLRGAMSDEEFEDLIAFLLSRN